MTNNYIRNMTENVNIITLEDGSRITEVNCECGHKLTITTKDCAYLYCSCGKRHMNIAYFKINEDGVLDYIIEKH